MKSGDIVLYLLEPDESSSCDFIAQAEACCCLSWWSGATADFNPNLKKDYL
ncbi:hypothetical protein ACFL6O_00465 [candidate division KSB1 bacterium]